MLFLRALVLQDTWSNRMLNLGGFGSGLLTFVSGLSDNILVDIERLKSCCILLALFGPNPRGTVVSSVSPGISVSPLFTITKLRTPAWHPQCASKQTCASSLQFSLVCHKNAPCSSAGTVWCLLLTSHGSRYLAFGESFVCHSHHGFGHTTCLPLFT